MKLYRQGDLLIKPAKLPAQAISVSQDPTYTLAVGEATGHAHRLRGGLEVLIEPGSERRFIRAGENLNLEHEEHGAVAIEPGDYEVVREREQDYLNERIRNVVD